jgi:molybdate transport system permease protein
LTARVAAAATLISLICGSLLGFVFGSRDFAGRRWLMAAVLLPLVLPPTVLGYYLLVLAGRRGPVGEFWMAVFGEPLVFTTNAAVLAACVSAIPIVTRQLAAVFAVINPEIIEAARIDGAGGLRLLFAVHLPLIRPSLFAAGTIAFARAVGDFGATLMVAGNIPGETQTASIAIYELMNGGRDGEALVLVAVISLVALLVLAFTSGAEINRARH